MDCAGGDSGEDAGTSIYFFHLLGSIGNSSGDGRSFSDMKTTSLNPTALVKEQCIAK